MNTLKLPMVLFAACVTLTPCAVSAEAMRDILIRAYKASNGAASGEITDGMAIEAKRRLPIDGPVMAAVTTVKHFKQPGCRRYQIALSAKMSKASGYGGKPAPLPTIQLNLCEDGSAPVEGAIPDAYERIVKGGASK